ncbi:MAG TPA: ATP-binding protein [Pseudomonadales bacterium]|nr:ATP-binding protein [Pseudomonadales bacterium]
MNLQPLDVKAAELLRLIDEGTASVTGEAFFRALVRKLSEGMQTRYTFVAEFDPALTRANVLAWWDSHGKYRDPFSFPLKGTPCELVATGNGDIVSYEADVAVCFPEDRAALERIGAKSYVAVPLLRPDGRVMGHLAVFDDHERVWDPMSLGLLRIFAARATAEVERRQFEKELESANADLERRVSERTAELAEIVQRLNAEIERRREVEQRLIHNEAEIRNLFEESPAALWVSDFSSAKRHIDDLRGRGITDLREYFRDRPSLLHRVVEMQQVQTVNKATLHAYEGTAIEQFFHLQPDDIFTPEAYAALGEMVLRFAEGAIEYDTEATDRTLAGNVRDRYMKWRLMPGREHDWSRVLVAVLDISEQKEAARFLKNAHDELEQRVHERTTALFVANSKLQQEVAKRTQTERALRISEKAFRELYEEAPSVYWSVSADGTIVRANRRATELFGYAQDEIVGMPLFDLVSDGTDGKPVAQMVRDKLLAGIATFNQEVEFVAKNGRTIWGSVSVTPYRNDAGEIEGTRSIITDITERKSMEIALRRRRELEALVTSTSTQIASVAAGELDAEIVRALELACVSLGAQRAFVCRQTDRSASIALTHRFDLSGNESSTKTLALERHLGRLRKTGVIHIVDASQTRARHIRHEMLECGAAARLMVPLRSGSSVVGALAIDVLQQPHRWADDEVELFGMLGETIAGALARRDIAVSLESAKLTAEAANRAKTEFLASTSHELRTPLNGILGYAQLLDRDQTLSDDQREAVQTIQWCGEHLLKIINELLDLAKIESSKFDLVPAPVDLPRLLQDTADLGRLRAAQGNLTFTFEIASALPKQVLADAAKLRQILLNLLSNAAKFTRSGGVALKVHAASEGAGTQLEFEVEDTGIGIPKKELTRIFEPFHQVGTQTEGTGLGLTITKRLVEAMGGSIEVTSRSGRGSRFVVRLALPLVNEAVAIETPPSRAVIGYLGGIRSILVADDKAENRSVLARLLEPLGFIVYQAADGNEALAVARQHRPDLVLMDLVMPNLDGFEAIRRLRLDPELAHVRTIAVSASAFDDTRRESLQQGAVDFIAKPVRVTELLERLRHHLDIEWVYADSEGSRTATPQTPAVAELPLPAPEELERMLELTTLGDIEGLNVALDMLAARTELAPFVAHLRGFTRQFQMNRIRALLESLRKRQD